MRNLNCGFLLLTALCMAVVLLGCARGESTSRPQESTHEVFIPERVINLSGLSFDEYVEDLRDAGSDHMASISKKDDGVEMVLSDSDIEFWQTTTDNYLSDISSRFESIGDKCSLEISGDSTNIKMTYWKDSPVDTINSLATGAEYWCAMKQLLSAQNGEWSVNMEVYNADNGALVARGQYGSDVLGMGLEYEDSDWDRS